MNAEDFFTWLERQDEKFELVNGQPVMMLGANKRHDRMMISAIMEIGGQRSGSGGAVMRCRYLSAINLPKFCTHSQTLAVR